MKTDNEVLRPTTERKRRRTPAKISKKNLMLATAYGSYWIIMEPDEKAGFIVTAPNLPGVTTWGKNIIHAKEMAREAIELCIECLVREQRGSLREKAPAAP